MYMYISVVIWGLYLLTLVEYSNPCKTFKSHCIYYNCTATINNYYSYLLLYIGDGDNQSKYKTI